MALGDGTTSVGTQAGYFGGGEANTWVGSQAGTAVAGDRNVALGYSAGTSLLGADPLNDTVSIGANAAAQANGAVAIGSGVIATRENQVALGSAAATYTLAGIASTDSTAAQSGDIYVVTTDAAGNLAASAFPVPDLSSINGRIDDAFSRIDTAYEGAAMAMAMAGASLPADKNYAISMNWGNFEGSNAFAGTAQARVSESFLVHGGIGYGVDTGSVGGRAGVTFAW